MPPKNHRKTEQSWPKPPSHLPALTGPGKKQTRSIVKYNETPIGTSTTKTKLVALIKELNVEVRKLKFSISNYLKKVEDSLQRLDEMNRFACFIFLVADLGCDVQSHDEEQE